MENRTEKPNENISSVKPPRSAYFWIAGIFGIVFSLIYIALVVFVNLVPTGNGIWKLNDAEAYIVYLFVFMFFLAALYMYVVISRKELLFNLKFVGALMTAFTFVVIVNISLLYFNQIGRVHV